MDIGKILRATRAARRSTDLPTRDERDLPFFRDMPEMGEAIMLDTCVYIDQLQDRLPREIEARVVNRSRFHSSLVLAELSFPFGRLDPAHPDTSTALDAIDDLMSGIQDRLILTPSHEVKMRGSILAGSMARNLGYNESQRKKCLMDAMIAAHAIQENLLFITKNVADYDRLSQLDSRLKVAFYRA